jgi:hypothetical protein
MSYIEFNSSKEHADRALLNALRIDSKTVLEG